MSVLGAYTTVQPMQTVSILKEVSFVTVEKGTKEMEESAEVSLCYILLSKSLA